MSAKRKVTPAALLSDAQEKLIQEFGLPPETVTFKPPHALPPCWILVRGEGKPMEYWLYRNATSGKLELKDEKPSSAKPHREDEPSDDDLEPQDLEKPHGVFRQTGKQSLADSIAPSRYNPDELEAHLRQDGFAVPEAKAIVAQVCDGATIRQAAKSIGKSHGWVSAQRIQRKVKALRAGQPLPAVKADIGLSQAVQKSHEAVEEERSSFEREHPTGNFVVLPPPTLTDAMRRARKAVEEFFQGVTEDLGHLCLALVELGVSATSSPAERLVAMIAVCPAILLQPAGRPNLEVLVQLLTAARYGSRAAAASARQTLAVLSRGRVGDRCPVPDLVLAAESFAICVRLAGLKQAWRGFSHDPIATRLEGIRKLIGEEHTRFPDRELLSLLAGEDNLPTASARAAEKATGISYKAFLRAWGEDPEIREFLRGAGSQ